MKAVGYITVTAILVPARMLWFAFVFCKLWAWFMVDGVFECPPLSLVEAIGLGLMVQIWTHKAKTEESEKDYDKLLVISCCDTLVTPTLVLGIGWCVKSFM